MVRYASREGNEAEAEDRREVGALHCTDEAGEPTRLRRSPELTRLCSPNVTHLASSSALVIAERRIAIGATTVGVKAASVFSMSQVVHA